VNKTQQRAIKVADKIQKEKTKSNEKAHRLRQKSASKAYDVKTKAAFKACAAAVDAARWAFQENTVEPSRKRSDRILKSKNKHGDSVLHELQGYNAALYQRHYSKLSDNKSDRAQELLASRTAVHNLSVEAVERLNVGLNLQLVAADEAYFAEIAPELATCNAAVKAAFDDEETAILAARLEYDTALHNSNATLLKNNVAA
jgi:hypothetical protein